MAEQKRQPTSRPFTVVALGVTVMLGVGAIAATLNPPPSAAELSDSSAAPEPVSAPTTTVVAPAAPSIVELHGLSVEDEPHVRAFLNLNVGCRYWTGAESEYSASVLDLLRLRRMGFASPPFDYEVRHEAEGEHHYVLVRERVKQRDGNDLPNAPGYVAHRYYFDPARERFELLDSTPDDPSFEPRILRSLGDPLSFLTLHWDAVCNGRLRLPEVRQALAARTAHRRAIDASAASDATVVGEETGGIAEPPTASESNGPDPAFAAKAD